jgi:transketolase C-terminal domain/subunit
MRMIGINDIFAVVGKYDEVMDYYGLTGPKIALNIEDFLNKT